MFKKTFTPTWAKRKTNAEEAARDAKYQEEVVGPLMGLDLDTEEDKQAAAAMARCICPKKNCPVHDKP